MTNQAPRGAHTNRLGRDAFPRGTASPSTGAPARSGLLAALLLTVVVAAVFGGGLRGEFLGPDLPLLDRSPFATVSSSSVSAGASAPALPVWLPTAVTMASLALDRAVWGPTPGAFRSTNLVLHLAAVLFFFFLARRWSGGEWGAFAAALLFAVHPLHVETLSLAAARGQTLAAALVFLALNLFARARAFNPDGALRPGGIALPLCVYLIATFCSPIALVLPLLLIVGDLLASRSAGAAWRRYGSGWIALAVCSIPSVLASLAVDPPLVPGNRWLAGRAFLMSLRVVFFPYPLDYYRIIGPQHGADPVSILAIVLALALCAALVVFRRAIFTTSTQAPVLLVIVPVLALVVFPPNPQGPDIPFPVQEHRLYLPAAGAAALIAIALATLAARFSGAGMLRRRPLAAALTAAIVAMPLAGLTIARQRNFQDDVSLYIATAATSPSAYLRLLLAHALARSGRTDKAIELTKRLVSQAPNDASLHLFLGNLSRDVRDLDAAEEETGAALRLNPSLASAKVTLGLIASERQDGARAEAEYREAIRLDPRSAEAHSNLGVLLAARGATAAALSEFRTATEIDPGYGDAAANLGHLLSEQRLLDEAEKVLRRGLELSEGNERVHYNLGVVLQKRGDARGAMDAYRNALRLNPGYASPRLNLATLYSSEKRFDEAIEELKRVLQLEPNNERAHYNLGLVYKEMKRVDLASAEFLTALKLRPDYTEANRALTALLNQGGSGR